MAGPIRLFNPSTERAGGTVEVLAMTLLMDDGSSRQVVALDWTQIVTGLGAILAMIMSIVGISTAYIRLYVRSEMLELEQRIGRMIDSKIAPLVTKEMMADRVQHLEAKVSDVESDVDSIMQKKRQRG